MTVSKSGAKRILIVEDEPSVLEMMERLFKRSGYVVDCAPAYDKAVTCLNAFEYEVVISDINLAGDGPPCGFDLVGEVRKSCPGATLIFLTAFGGYTVMEKAFKAGADAYFEKPVRVEDLLNAVKAGKRRRAS